MDKLLILGTSNGCCDIVEYAKQQGIYTIVTDYLKPIKSRAKLISDEYWMINTADIENLEHRCKEEGVNGIICGVTEFNLNVCMELSKRLGLQTYCTPEAWSYSHDKRKFKDLCKRVGVPMATDYYVSRALTEEELDKVVFPVVVKPVDLSGNRGISYCFDKNDLRKAYKYALSVSNSDKIIVERMLRGKQVTGFYAIADGEFSLQSLSSMNYEEGYPKNCYCVTTTISDLVEKYIKEENDIIIKALKEVGCKQGICWVELIYDQDGHFYLLEMGYRLPGDMIFLPLSNVSSFNTIKWLTDYALGHKRTIADLPKPQLSPYKRCATVYLLWCKNAGTITTMQGIDEITSLPNVRSSFLNHIGDTVSQYRPLGQFTFDSDSPDDVCELINKINKTVIIKNENGEDMAIHYTNFDNLKNMYYNPQVK